MIPLTLETPTEIKARGAYYTPEAITAFLANWGIRSAEDRVLEPSCGDGAFLGSVVDRFRDLGETEPGRNLIGIEREPAEAAKARLVAPHAGIRTVDFFDLDPRSVPPVDFVVGNPPYIRYQAFIGPDRGRALARTRAAGVALTNLASSWAHFVVHATTFLKPSGRLALVVPAELLHADYAGPVREFLLRRFSSINVIAFDRMTFEDAQVDAVLLLASNDASTGLLVHRVTDERGLALLDTFTGPPSTVVATEHRWSAAVDLGASRTYSDACNAHGAWTLGSVASVDIGFVSGANDFFVLDRERARQLGLPDDVLTPVVGRPRDVRGLSVEDSELSLLLTLNRGSELDAATLRYLAVGVERAVPSRYKCRVRTPWYAVPLPKRQPDAFLPYMAHLGPRLIINSHGARNSNLLHGVSLKPFAPSARLLAVAMRSSLTLLSAEIEGRSYGGGVLKLETREAEKLRIPEISGVAGALEDHFDEVDKLVAAADIRAASRVVDAILRIEHETLWDAYLVYRDRRLGRKAATRPAPPGR